MNLTPEEITMLESSTSSEDWNKNVDKIKEARNGQYPLDWWAVMKLSGRMERIMNSFGETSELKFTSFNL